MPIKINVCNEYDWAKQPKDEDVTLSSLQNEVHPLWGRENFIRGTYWADIEELMPTGRLLGGTTQSSLSKARYDKLKPALQLATLFIQEARPAFLRIMFAKVINGVLDQSYSATLEDELELNIILDGMSRRLRIYIAPLSEWEKDGEKWIRPWRASGEPHGCIQKWIGHPGQPIFMHLHSDFLINLSPSNHKQAITTTLQEHYLHLAHTCIHELAHAVNLERDCGELYQAVTEYNRRMFKTFHCFRGRNKLCWTREEPLFQLTDKKRELGYAVDSYLYAGVTRLRSDYGAPSKYVPGMRWVSSDPLYNQGGPIVYRITPESISRLFDAATWVNDSQHPPEFVIKAFAVDHEFVQQGTGYDCPKRNDESLPFPPAFRVSKGRRSLRPRRRPVRYGHTVGRCAFCKKTKPDCRCPFCAINLR